jgi:hypothetical protein
MPDSPDDGQLPSPKADASELVAGDTQRSHVGDVSLGRSSKDGLHDEKDWIGTDEPSDPMPEPKTPAARKALEEFKLSVRGELDRMGEVALSILVWGPSPTSASPAAKKRIEIGRALSEAGHNAMFSEQLFDQVPKAGWSAKALEYAQAKHVHLIFILLEDSPGALAEAHDFIWFPNLAPKCTVLVPLEYRSGYSALGALKEHQDSTNGVEWYTRADLEACRVLGSVMRRSESMRLRVYRLRDIKYA